jgi:arylsulfatase A-like enzyme
MLAACSLPAAKPNVLVILAEDLGYGDIEAFDGNLCNVDNPHFDRLCAEGMMFFNAHVTDSICVPSHTSIILGANHTIYRYPDSGS